ncbi:hypothetical protein BC828DRAFT_410028 [Blastocladiella britannica]|nr:hypothetical protein BC828DRAFT_410028 [Blastocladiella britannica]
MTSVESVTSGTASNGAQATTAGDVGGPRRPTSAGSSSSAASTRREQAAAGLASAAERAAAMIPTPPQSPPLLSPSEDDLGQQSPEPTASARQYTAAPTVKTLKRAQSSKGSTDSQDSFYDWKVLRKQTHRRNVEQWGMEVIVIRRLRFLVDHLDELSGQHIPLLETLEASGVTAQQLHQYFPFVNTVHDLRLHLTTLLAERGPNAASSPSIPGSNAPRKLASEPHSGTQTACLPASTRHPYPAAVPSVSRRSYGHTTPLRTPMEVLKIVEAFRPVSESVARARTGARSHETHSGH